MTAGWSPTGRFAVIDLRWRRVLALGVALGVAGVAACSSGPSKAAQTEVRGAVLTWFEAAKDGDTAAAVATMSSSCAQADIHALGLFSQLAKDVEVLGVEVRSIDGDRASATLNLSRTALGGGGPQQVKLSREGGIWKMRCDS